MSIKLSLVERDDLVCVLEGNRPKMDPDNYGQAII